MRAIKVQHPGDPSVLKVCDVPTPKVKPGWSLLKVRGFGINHSELFTRQGKSPSVQFPRILGIEAVGEIVATTDPKRLPVGQTALSIMGEMGRAFDGSYAEYALLPNQQLYPFHSELSWAELAAIPETGYTAYGALLGLQLQSQQTLLIRGGSSGVGVMAAKLAKAMQPDIQVAGSTRQLTKSAALLARGFDLVVGDVDNHLLTNHRFDRILDLIGPATVPDSLQFIRQYGIVSSTGQLGGQWTLSDFDPITQIPNDGYLTSFYSGEVVPSRLDQLFQLIATKHVDVKPDKVFDLDGVKAAHDFLEHADNLGKVVVLPWQ